MRIVPYTGEEDFEDIPTITAIVKAVPFEGSYVPACVMHTPHEDYVITLEELNAVMDGAEIITKQIDEMINYLITPKQISAEDLPEGVTFTAEVYDQEEEEDEEE